MKDKRTYNKLKEHGEEMTYENEIKISGQSRGALDLTFLIEQHRQEIWEFKKKEMEWIRTKNQLDGNKRIIEELSMKIVDLKKELDRLSEENDNLRTIDSSHQDLNGKLRKQITEVEIEMANLKAIGNNSPEMKDLKRDNKYLAEKVESYREILRKAGL
jgi:chromosome segregation ATPase